MKLMVIDGNSIVNRAYYGIRPLSTKDGLYTHGIYGFLNILEKMRAEEMPDGLCVTFDRKGPTFRHMEFEGYKAQRKGMPEELAMQIPVLKEVLDALNIPRYELEGFEADDLIGTICKRSEDAGWDAVVVTGDKDSLQLIDDHVTVSLVTTRMGQTTTKRMTRQAFEEEYGFSPIQMVDFKGLMGDPSDNIPGVAGVGEKTALQLVRQYGTISNLYDHLESGDTGEMKPALLKKLTEGKKQACLSYRLATIERDAPMSFDPKDTLIQAVDQEKAYPMFLRLEFHKLIEKYGLNPAAGAAGKEEAPYQIQRVDTKEAADALLAQCMAAEQVAFYPLNDLEGLAICLGDTVYVVLATWIEAEYTAFSQLFFGPAVKKVTHEVKELMGKLMASGLPAQGFVFDTALAAYLLAPTDGSYALDRLSVSYLQMQLPQALPRDIQAFSALGDQAEATDAFAAWAKCIQRLHSVFAPKLAELKMDTLYETVEMPLCRVLADMERTGFLVDQAQLRAFGNMLTEGIETAQNHIYELAGEQFNINSTKQLGEILFSRLGLPPVKKTKTGYSTNADVLERLRGKHPIIGEILEYRQLTKLKSTYVDGLFKVIAPDGRIHTSFQMTVTATGRLSSIEPNLQNIPVRTKLGREMRRMFLAGEGCVLVDADYSQIELRLLAHIAGDERMQAAFASGIDIHTMTASQVFNVPVEQVTPWMRSSAKAVNFGIVYGISDFSLSQDIGVTRREARQYMDQYLEKYAGVRRYMKEIVEKAKEDGYVETLMHRRRYLPELSASNYNTRAFGERVALNMPIQGTAADVIKLAMVRVHQRLLKEAPEAKLVLQVHDELIVECKQADAEQVKALLKEEMEGVMTLSTPLKVDVSVGKTWYDAKS